MAQGNNMTAMCSQQTRLKTNTWQDAVSWQCHSSVTKTRENPDKGDRTVTRCSSVANLVSGMFKFKLQ